jgi:hypothetical protein
MMAHFRAGKSMSLIDGAFQGWTVNVLNMMAHLRAGRSMFLI